MPYYSIRIVGGKKPEERSAEVREALRGRDADHTGARTFCYVQNHRSESELQALVEGMADKDNDVRVKRIKRDEYFWKKHQ